MSFRFAELGSVLLSQDSGEWGDDPVGTGDIPVVRVADIEPDHTIDFKAAPMRSVPARKLESKILDEDDVLVVKASGSATNIISGRAALVPSLAGQTYGFANFLLRLKVDKSQYHPYLLATILNSPAFRKRIPEVVSPTTYPNLRIDQFLKLPIPKPSIDEQRRIVDLFSRAQSIVQMRKGAEAKAKQIIPALFMDMFGDPIDNPKGWNSLRFGDVVFDVRNGFNPSKAAFGSGTPFVTVNTLYNGLEVDVKAAERVEADNGTLEKYTLHRGDLCFARSSVKRAGVGMASVYDSEDRAIFGGFVIRVRLRSGMSPLFTCAMMHTPAMRSLIVDRAGTGTITNINQPALLALPIICPPLQLQLEYVTRLRLLQGMVRDQGAATQTSKGIFQSLLAGVFG